MSFMMDEVTMMTSSAMLDSSLITRYTICRRALCGCECIMRQFLMFTRAQSTWSRAQASADQDCVPEGRMPVARHTISSTRCIMASIPC